MLHGFACAWAYALLTRPQFRLTRGLGSETVLRDTCATWIAESVVFLQRNCFMRPLRTCWQECLRMGSRHASIAKNAYGRLTTPRVLLTPDSQRQVFLNTWREVLDPIQLGVVVSQLFQTVFVEVSDSGEICSTSLIKVEVPIIGNPWRRHHRYHWMLPLVLPWGLDVKTSRNCKWSQLALQLLTYETRVKLHKGLGWFWGLAARQLEGWRSWVCLQDASLVG